MPDGLGVYGWNNGERYVGWRLGKRIGDGTMHYATGLTYTGDRKMTNSTASVLCIIGRNIFSLPEKSMLMEH